MSDGSLLIEHAVAAAIVRRLNISNHFATCRQIKGRRVWKRVAQAQLFEFTALSDRSTGCWGNLISTNTQDVQSGATISEIENASVTDV